MGHAGAIVGGAEDTAAAKIAVFKECGIEVAATPSDMADALLRSAKAKGVTVILVSPIPHKDRWETGRDFAGHAQWTEEVARAGGALYFDLTLVISASYQRIGKDKVGTFFSDRGTHTNDEGARFNAARVIEGLQALRGNPLAAYFSAAP